MTLQCSHFREGAAAYLLYKAELSLILLRVLGLANCSSRIFVCIELFSFNLAVQFTRYVGSPLEIPYYTQVRK